MIASNSLEFLWSLFLFMMVFIPVFLNSTQFLTTTEAEIERLEREIEALKKRKGEIPSFSVF
jgi:hypothetical protein